MKRKLVRRRVKFRAQQITTACIISPYKIYLWHIVSILLLVNAKITLTTPLYLSTLYFSLAFNCRVTLVDELSVLHGRSIQNKEQLHPMKRNKKTGGKPSYIFSFRKSLIPPPSFSFFFFLLFVFWCYSFRLRKWCQITSLKCIVRMKGALCLGRNKA